MAAGSEPTSSISPAVRRSKNTSTCAGQQRVRVKGLLDRKTESRCRAPPAQRLGYQRSQSRLCSARCASLAGRGAADVYAAPGAITARVGRRHMQRIVVLNPKGGSGKTTIAINLASHFALLRRAYRADRSRSASFRRHAGSKQAARPTQARHPPDRGLRTRRARDAQLSTTYPGGRPTASSSRHSRRRILPQDHRLELTRVLPIKILVPAYCPPTSISILALRCIQNLMLLVGEGKSAPGRETAWASSPIECVATRSSINRFIQIPGHSGHPDRGHVTRFPGVRARGRAGTGSCVKMKPYQVAEDLRHSGCTAVGVSLAADAGAGPLAAPATRVS